MLHHLITLWETLVEGTRRLRLPQLMRLWPFAILILVISWLMGLSIGQIPEDIAIGGIAPYDIRADRQYVIVDEQASEDARSEALKKAKAVYDFDASRADQIAARVHEAFEAARTAAAIGTLDHTTQATPWIDPSRAQFERVLGIALRDPQWQALTDSQWNGIIEEALISPIRALLQQPVIAEIEELKQERERGIFLRKLSMQESEQHVEEVTWQGEDIDTIRPLDQARQEVVVTIDEKKHKLLTSLAEALLQPNVSRNLLESERRRTHIGKGVPPVSETVKAGELIARRYEPLTERQVKRLTSIQRQKAGGTTFLQTLGTIFFITIVILLLHGFAQRFIRKYRPSTKDLYFLGTLLIAQIAIVRAGILLSEALTEGLRLPIPPFAYYYLIPLATGGMLVRYLLNAETALIYSIAMGALSGILFPHDPSFTAYVFLTNIAAAAAIAHADRRAMMIRAGVLTGSAAIVTVMAIHLMHAGALNELLTASTMTWYVAMAFAGALFSSVLVLALTPLAESFFGYTSDIKLLELANLNHPLLRELVLRAPGTYHHSHLVGILSESAAMTIGANPLLARVSAYYHDIGKIRKPLYFTENQKGESPHDRLTPHMSALIIAAHVKDGLELARQNKLPQQIIDMIPQHHGTKHIGYFFEKAKQMANPDQGAVAEKDFRYPGPKPQSREAGILLLADGTEGAVRALKEKTPARIQQTVDNIINKSFAEGQLDECEMTLKNLNEIGKAFTHILLGIYHHRIEYPRETLQLGTRDVHVMEPSDAGNDEPPTIHRPRAIKTSS